MGDGNLCSGYNSLESLLCTKDGFSPKSRFCWDPWSPPNASLRLLMFGVGRDFCVAGV